MTLLFDAMRDLMAHWLPSKFARLILPTADYIFLVHPINFGDAAKKYPFAKYLPKKLIDFWATHYWSILGAEISGLTSTDGTPLKGHIIITPLTPEQMFSNTTLARRKILSGVKLAKKMGASLVGLGGFNSILTHDGKDLLGKVEINITTGNSLSALTAIENLRKAMKAIGVKSETATLAIVGAAGSVGSACAKVLVNEVNKLIIIDVNDKANKKLYDELIKLSSSDKIEAKGVLDGLDKCDCIITATSSFVPIVKPEHLKSGAIIVDACQPKNVSPEVVVKRRDVLVVDSGILESNSTKCQMDLGPAENEVFACLGEVLILMYNDIHSDYSIGKVSAQQVCELSKYFEKSEIKLAKFRNEEGYISQAQINEIVDKTSTSKSRN